jgi:hypothetical protein
MLELYRELSILLIDTANNYSIINMIITFYTFSIVVDFSSRKFRELFPLSGSGGGSILIRWNLANVLFESLEERDHWEHFAVQRRILLSGNEGVKVLIDTSVHFILFIDRRLQQFRL